MTLFIHDDQLLTSCSPVADDRGGIPDDYKNYVNLLRRLRQRLNSTGREYGISLAIVSTTQTPEGRQ